MTVTWSFVRPSTLHVYRHSKSGSWALVTGASDGIGLGFCEELLARGFNVLLHGRNPQKLDRIIGELSTKYPERSLDKVIADASKYDNGYEEIARKVKSLHGPLTVLVNNVGTFPLCTGGNNELANYNATLKCPSLQILKFM